MKPEDKSCNYKWTNTIFFELK